MQGEPIRLAVEFCRINDRDEAGTVEITSTGRDPWLYVCIGSHHSMQGEHEGHDERVMDFGAKMAALVREHFGDNEGGSRGE